LWAVVSAGYPALLSCSYFERINDDDDDDDDDVVSSVADKKRPRFVNLEGDAENARPENDGQRKLWVWKMQDWKMTDKLLANCEHNYGVWSKMLSVIFQSCIFRSCIFSRPISSCSNKCCNLFRYRLICVFVAMLMVV